MKSYIGYIRVSTAKQGQLGSSLQEQRDAIVAFSERFDLPVVQWFEDRETAAKKGRAQFLKMMTLLENRKAAGVILHKIDRGARNLWDWARLQGLIDTGIEVHFAHDNLDLTSRGGRLAADIQAVVAADYVRNLRDEVRKGQRGRLKQGIYPWKAPAGYLDQGRAKPKIIDPIKGPLVREAFTLYATKRFSYRTLRVELHSRGLCNARGTPLCLRAITRILRNPFYIGIMRNQRTGEVFEGVHPKLVDAHTFQCVQDLIDGRENVYNHRHEFAFRRLLTCGLCHYALTGERQKGHIYYRCHTRNCPTTSIREEAVAAILRGVIDGLPFSSRDLIDMAPYFEREQRLSEQKKAEIVASLQLRIATMQDREQRLTDAYLDGTVDRDAYSNRRAALLAGLAQARENLTRVENGEFNIAWRIGKFFELLKTYQLGPASTSGDEFHQAMKILTSNCSLIGEKLTIEPRSPFKEMIRDAELLFCGHSRDELRTSRELRHHAKEGKPLRSSPTEEQFVSFRDALMEWEIPEWFAKPKTKQRKPNPGWFKPRQPSQYPPSDSGTPLS